MAIVENIIVTSQKKGEKDVLFETEKSVSFKAYKRVYSTKTQDNKDYIHFSCFATSDVKEKIKKMKLSPGSRLLITGDITSVNAYQYDNGSILTTINVKIAMVDYVAQSQSTNQPQSQPQSQSQPQNPEPSVNKESMFEELDFQPLDDAELPF